MQALIISCGYFPTSEECVSCPLTWPQCPNISKNGVSRVTEQGKRVYQSMGA